MKRIAWATDIHLEFVDTGEMHRFCQSILETTPDIVLLGGDIGNAPTIEEHLIQLEMRLQCPIYFVLGNHDFYGGSIANVRSIATKITNGSRWLRWLSNLGVVELTKNTGLIGHDGWADGRLGNSVRSQVLLNDFFQIAELTSISPKSLFLKLNALGDEAADYFKTCLPSALSRFSNLILLTHVPPFKESCWHEGQISDDDFLPHFTCSAVGKVLIEIMQNNRDCYLTVLCGHTHGKGEARILPNLFVKTGGAVYGCPGIQELITAY